MRQSDTQLRTATKNREEAAARVRCVVCVCGVNVALALFVGGWCAAKIGTAGAGAPLCGLALGAFASFALASFAVKIGKGVCNDTLLH